MFVKQKECRLYSCHKPLDFPACEVKLERPHPTDVGWGRSNRRQHPSGLRLSVPTSHHFPNALHFFRPAAASPTRRPNAKLRFARGCSLQGCRWCGRGARVSFFFFLFVFFSASLFSLSFLISLAPRLRRDAFIFLFAFLHIFVFYFCFFFLFLFLLFFLLFSF